jgi:hypothetical protein
MPDLSSIAPGRARALAAALMAAVLLGCVGVDYARPGEGLEPRAGEALVFGRIRFVYDGQEYYPWRPTPLPRPQRHLWLLRLDRRAVSAELHPDQDGSLAIWVPPGDYALVGSIEKLESMGDFREVVALLRVPGPGAPVYAGDLVLATEFREGGHWNDQPFGIATVAGGTVEAATALLRAKYGATDGTSTASPWCAGPGLPAFTDPALASRARRLLEQGCPVRP